MKEWINLYIYLCSIDSKYVMLQNIYDKIDNKELLVNDSRPDSVFMVLCKGDSITINNQEYIV